MLRVMEVFDSLQGEGVWAGIPMTFVRLAGCNAPGLGLGCVAWCDTRDSWRPGAGKDLTVEEIIGMVRLPRLCVTGGEPLLQAEAVSRLALAAHERDIRVHLETNGTLPPPAAPGCAGGRGTGGGRLFDWVVVSPKPPAYFISPAWTGLLDELKLIVDENLDGPTAERLAAAHPGARVSVQPVARSAGFQAESGPSLPWPDCSVRRAVALVREHPDWRLSLQLHKILGLP